MNLFQLFVIALVVIIILLLVFQFFYRKYTSSECSQCDEEKLSRAGKQSDFEHAEEQIPVFVADDDDSESDIGDDY